MSIESRDDCLRVTIEGHYGASRAPEVVSELLAGFERSSTVELALDGISGTDTSLVQLLISAQATATLLGSTLKVINYGFGVKDALTRCGFQYLLETDLFEQTEEVGYFYFGEYT